MKDRGEAHITVHSASESHGMGDIFYSNSENASSNTASGWLTIDSDEYDLFLHWRGMGYTGEDQRVSSESAAELLWKEFLSRAGIEYE